MAPFPQRFSSSISSHAEERIAGFEVVDIWEGRKPGPRVLRTQQSPTCPSSGKRAAHAAMESAVAEYAMGSEARTRGQVQQALNHFGAGVMALEEFWNEVNRKELDGQMVTTRAPPPANHAQYSLGHSAGWGCRRGGIERSETTSSSLWDSMRHHRWQTRHRLAAEIPIPQRHLHETRDRIHR